MISFLKNSATFRFCVSMLLLWGFAHADEGPLPILQTLGGVTEISWNRSLLPSLGLQISEAIQPLGARDLGFDRFALSDSSELTVVTQGASIRSISAGIIGVRGGYVLNFDGGNVAIQDFTLRRRPGSATVFDVVTPYGETPFFVDNVLVEPGAEGRSISVRSMDLKLSPWFAKRISRPEASGWSVATMRLNAQLAGSAGAALNEACPSSSHWPGMPVTNQPGQHYQADVLMESFALQIGGCESCTGPNGQGRTKLVPTTILRNNVDSGAFEATVPNDPMGTSKAAFSADLPWRNMFSAACPPYNNDQHPYLTWALYRIDKSNRIEQIAQAGVKHAHTAQNGECLDNPSSNHVLGRGCADVYGAGDNDAADLLGPRSEIIPSTGQWGRCGSIYDPNCTGTLSGSAGSDPWRYRLVVSENDISGKDGSRFFFEAWYVVRDDIDPYNSMAHVPVEFLWNSTNRLWSVRTTGKVKLGSVIDEWANSQRAAIQEVRTSEGRFKIALRSTIDADGSIGYDLVVMNFDFAHVRTGGREPNLRILSSEGIGRISISFKDDGRSTTKPIHVSTSHQWRGHPSAGGASWATSDDPLAWGTLRTFTFDSSKAHDSIVIDLFSGPKNHIASARFAGH